METINAAPPDEPPPSHKKSIRFSRGYSNDLKRSSSMTRSIPREMVQAHKQDLHADKVWYAQDDDSWTLYDVVSQVGSTVTLSDPSQGTSFEVDLNFRDVFPHDTNVVSDMTYLRSLCEPTILHNLKARSMNQKPYTYMGPILIAVNPFEWYDFPDPKLFIGKPTSPDNPHPYAIAELAYQQICLFNAVDQSVVISGESGAGKTESAKMVLSYVVGRATGQIAQNASAHAVVANLLEDSDAPAVGAASSLDSGSHIEERLLQSSPVLEAFGNAKTLRNSNSSRFGKYIKIFFHPAEGAGGRRLSRLSFTSYGAGEVQPAPKKQRRITSASVETYLLEKSRVAGPCIGEDNYHVFYNLLAAVEGGEPTTASLGLTSSTPHGYLILCGSPASQDAQAASVPSSGSDSTTPQKRDYLRQYSGTTTTRQDQFRAIESSMRTLGYSEDELVSTWRVLGAILELGNLQFVDEFTSNGEGSRIENPQSAVLAAHLLGVTEVSLVDMLTKREMKTGRETYSIPLRAKDAENGRAALCKSLYSNLFASIVATINRSIAATPSVQSSVEAAVASGGKVNSISVLDIFGFESFERNEFEQLLINYANEALQNTFNTQVFQQELKLFEEEHISTTLTIEECPSNQPCVNLIYGQNNSIISILQTTGELANASDDKFAESLHKSLGGLNSAEIRKFFPTVHPKDRKHMFTVNHFAGRVTYSVGSPGTSVWLTKNHDAIPDGMAPLLESSSLPIVVSLAPPSPPAATRRPSLSSRKLGTNSVASKFTISMTALCNALQDSNCSFIRCIKPNKEQKPRTFNNSYSLDQVRSLGLVQVCEVMKVGLPTRLTYSELDNSLGPIVAEGRSLFSHETTEVFMGSLLCALGIPDDAYELGKTRIFFRAGQLDTVDRILSTDFEDAKADILLKLQQALSVREQTKAHVDGLSRALVEAGSKFDSNRSQIEAMESLIDEATALAAKLAEACVPMKDAVDRVQHSLSSAQLAVHDVEVNAQDLLSAGGAQAFQPVKDIIDQAATHLRGADELWKQIDKKAVAVEEFVDEDSVENIAAANAILADKLAVIEEDMPDLQLTVHKTMVHANRCHITKLEKRVDECVQRIDSLKTLLAENEAAIQATTAKVRIVADRVKVVLDQAAEVTILVAEAEKCEPTVMDICRQARMATQEGRNKLFTDAKQREDMEKEAARREEEERVVREKQEKLAMEAQVTATSTTGVAATTASPQPGSVAGQSSGVDNAAGPLPAGWLSVYDSDRGASYFINKLTGKTQWKRPLTPAQTADSLTRTGLQSVRIDGADMVALKATLSFVNDGTAAAAAHTARTLHRLFSSICEVEVVETDDAANSRSSSPFRGSPSLDRPDSPPRLGSGADTAQVPPPAPPTKSTKPVGATTVMESAAANSAAPKREIVKELGGSGAKEFVALRTAAAGPPEEVVVRVFKKGILLKQGKYFGSWRKLFFVLDGNSLEHYPSTQAYMSGVPATKTIILTGKGSLSYTKYSQCFTVCSGERTTWTMMAENASEFDEWMNGLRTVMGALFDDRITRVGTSSPRAKK